MAAPNLPHDVMRRVIGYLVHGYRRRFVTSRDVDMPWDLWGLNESAPLYAGVCRTWQDIIEREAFETLELDLTRLSDFGTIMTPRRRAYVETVEEQEQNNAITTATIKAFIEKIGEWKAEDLSGHDQLIIRIRAFSPSDEYYCTPEEMDGRRIFPRPQWRQIYEKRFENSVLELTKDLDPLELPVVHIPIHHLEVVNRHHRYFAPAVICTLVGRLWNARYAACHMWDDTNDVSERRHRIRDGKKDQPPQTSSARKTQSAMTDYARAVRNITVPPGTLGLNQRLHGFHPENHSMEAPVFTPPGTEDALSRSLHDVSRRAKTLVLGDAILGTEFFDPSPCTDKEEDQKAPHWPLLTNLSIGFRLTTPDGQWLFDYAEPESESESESEEGDSGSSDEESDGSKSDYGHVNSLRRRAVPELTNNLYRAAAQAALEMPQLKVMQLRFNGWGFQDVTFHDFIYEVKDPGVTVSWFSYPPFQPEEDVVEAWKQVGAKFHNTIPEIIISEERPQLKYF